MTPKRPTNLSRNDALRAAYAEGKAKGLKGKLLTLYRSQNYKYFMNTKKIAGTPAKTNQLKAVRAAAAKKIANRAFKGKGFGSVTPDTDSEGRKAYIVAISTMGKETYITVYAYDEEELKNNIAMGFTVGSIEGSGIPNYLSLEYPLAYKQKGTDNWITYDTGDYMNRVESLHPILD